MAFTGKGSDIIMLKTPTGKLDFDWGLDGNPKYDDSNTYRVMSLLIEHRESPGNPGWMWDSDGIRGSLLYTVKNVKRSTPSQLEAYALDGLQKAVNEGWILSPTAKAFMSKKPPTLEVGWTNPGGKYQSTRITIVT